MEGREKQISLNAEQDQMYIRLHILDGLVRGMARGRSSGALKLGPARLSGPGQRGRVNHKHKMNKNVSN